jgi:hypothetical protein
MLQEIYIKNICLDSYRPKIPKLKNIALMDRIWDEGKFDIESGNLLLKLVGLRFKESYNKSDKCCLFRAPFINNDNLELPGPFCGLSLPKARPGLVLRGLCASKWQAQRFKLIMIKCVKFWLKKNLNHHLYKSNKIIFLIINNYCIYHQLFLL